jgi:dienelactone hydrolase
MQMLSAATSPLRSILSALLLLACGVGETARDAAGTTDIAPAAPGAPARLPDARARLSTPPTAEEIALFDYDATAALDVVERGRERRGGVTRVDLTYVSPHGGRVPAWVYEPDHEGPHAGLILMHGLPGNRDGNWPLAVRYAHSGAVVIAISAPFARRDEPRDWPVTFTEQDRTEQIQLIVDLRRAVDYLVAHPDVDPERIGYVGASYGGAMGGLLAGVERRVAAYALVVGDGGLVAHHTGAGDLARKRMSAQRWQAWIDAMEPIEPSRFVGLATPTPLLFQSGHADQMVPAVDAVRYQQAANQPKTILWYESGHARTPEMIRDQVHWLAQHLEIDPDRFSRTRMSLVWDETLDWLRQLGIVE